MANKAIIKLEELNLVDRFLFAEVMEDKEVCEAVVSILLEDEIRLLDRPETEKEFRVSPELRQVRLDVVSMGEEKRLYYTEMQKRNTWNLRKRSRYYQAQLDVSLLEPGSKNFNLLNDSCFILVAPFDIFGRGLYRYTFEGTCRECPDLKMDDGAVRVFINTSGTNKEDFSQEFLDFMEYITDTTDQIAAKAGSSRMACIHERVKEVRQSEKMGVKYMQLWEEQEYIREDAYNEGLEMGQKRGHELGFEEGHEEGRKEGEKKLLRLICKGLQKGKTSQELAEAFEESAERLEGINQLAIECEFDCDKIYDKLYTNQLTDSCS